MHIMYAFNVFLITLIVSVSTELHHNSDKNSDPSAIINSFCNRDAEKIAVDVIVFDNNNNNNQQDTLLQHGIHDDKSMNKNKRHASGRNEYKDRPRPNQRSLVIIFDGTASMHDDLKQLTDGAQKIVNELSKRKDNPIFNYVLVVFRDPSKKYFGHISLNHLAIQSFHFILSHIITLTHHFHPQKVINFNV